MTAQKILLVVTSITTAQPFITSIARQLDKLGHAVEVLDLSVLELHSAGRITPIAPRWAALLTGVRKVGVLAQILAVSAFCRRMAGKYDAVTIHSCDHVYVHLAKSLRRLTGNFSGMIWGSDFYRIGTDMREEHRRIFDRLDHIVFANPGNARDFNEHYRDEDYRRKSVLAGFGNDKFDLIRDTEATEGRASARAHFGFPGDRLTVACGYNGREIQQHGLLLEALAAQPPAIRDQLHLVFQFGYGGSRDYRLAIEAQAQRSGLQAQFLDDELDDRAIARLRLATDLTLTAQVSDGLSHSIQEALFAGSVLLAGDWLPYDYLQANGVYLCRASPAEFPARLGDIVSHFEEHRQRASGNAPAMQALSGWQSQGRRWDRLYAGEPEPVFPEERPASSS